MKTCFIICLLLLSVVGLPQQTKPCKEWLNDFVQKEPKTTDGMHIDKYVSQKLGSDSSLRKMATCMVGVKIYSNCDGQFSYEKQSYRNNPGLTAQCNALLKKTERALNDLKLLSPGTIGGDKKDFTFKLVVRIKNNGEPVAEVLY